MLNQDSVYRHLWHPDLFEIFELARLQKSQMTIQSHLPLDRCNSADIAMIGHMGALRGQQADFIVDSMDMALEKRFPADPGCEYSFALDVPIGGRRPARIEYGGKATILDRVLHRNDLPSQLTLRIALPTRIRHVRRHQRKTSYECQDMIPGLILIDREPTNRRQLLRLLEHYFRKENYTRPKLLNISAGGVCLETTDASGYRLLAADERYLFFFFMKTPLQEKTPMVFLGRKVGAFKPQDSGSAALRIQFLRELVWKGPNTALEWRDILLNGSDKLRALLGIPHEEKSVASINPLVEKPLVKPRPRRVRHSRVHNPVASFPEIPPIEQMSGANMAKPFKSED